jgi:urea carboxylase
MPETAGGTRYTHGGDEWIVVELDEAMSLQVNCRARAITTRIAEERIDGVIEICPGNAAYMLRIDPDRLDPEVFVEYLREIEAEIGEARGFEFHTRIIDVPVLFEDEWTHETLMRFRDRHQTPELTDIEFAAQLNGFDSKEAFIDAVCGAPFLVSMIGFVPTVPWCYQLVPDDRQIEVPKYIRPRLDSPERAFCWGGAFAGIYPVRGAGGFQLLGMCPAPIVEPSQRLWDFKESYSLPRAGDLFNYRQIDREEFDDIRARVQDGSFRYRMHPVEFIPGQWFDDPDTTTKKLVSVLHGT